MRTARQSEESNAFILEDCQAFANLCKERDKRGVALSAAEVLALELH